MKKITLLLAIISLFMAQAFAQVVGSGQITWNGSIRPNAKGYEKILGTSESVLPAQLTSLKLAYTIKRDGEWQDQKSVLWYRLSFVMISYTTDNTVTFKGKSYNTSEFTSQQFILAPEKLDISFGIDFNGTAIESICLNTNWTYIGASRDLTYSSSCGQVYKDILALKGMEKFTCNIVGVGKNYDWTYSNLDIICNAFAEYYKKNNPDNEVNANKNKVENKKQEEKKSNDISSNEQPKTNTEQNKTQNNNTSDNSNSGGDNGQTNSGSNNSEIDAKNKELEQKKLQSKENYENMVKQNEEMEKNVKNEMDKFSEKLWDDAKAEKNYNNYKSNIQENTTLSNTKDPDKIIKEYEIKMKNIEIANEKYKEQRLAALQKEVDKLKSSGTAQDKVAGDIANLVSTNMIQKQIEDAQTKAQNELKQQKEEAFNKIKTDLINENESQKDKYLLIASTKLDIGEENNYLEMVDYFQCNINYINAHFSYYDTDWIKSNCKKPQIKSIKSSNKITAGLFYETAKRKVKNDHEYFQKAAMDYINLAIDSDPNNPEYYYYKTSMVSDINEKIIILNKVIEIDPDYPNAKEDYDFYSAKRSLKLKDISKFLVDFPISVHKSEAISIKKYIEDITLLDELLANKKILEANALHLKVQKHTLYSRDHIKNLKMLDFVEEEICFLKALENDKKGIKLKKRKEYYQDYMDLYPRGIHKDTVARRIKLLDMKINGYYATFTGAVSFGSVLKEGDEYYSYSSYIRAKTGTDFGWYDGFDTRNIKRDYATYGYSFGFSQYNLIFKSQKTKFPRIDLEIIANFSSNGGKNGEIKEGFEESDYTTNSLVVNKLNELNSSFNNYSVSTYYEHNYIVNNIHDEDEIKDKVRIRNGSLGAQLWIGKMFGFFLIHNNFSYYRRIDLTTVVDEFYNKTTKSKKIVPGFSFAPLNNHKDLIKFSYCKMEYKTTDVDAFLRKFEITGNFRMRSEQYKNWVLGFNYNLNYYTNNKYSNTIYDFKKFRNQMFYITAGLRI